MSAMIVRAAELARYLHNGQLQADGGSYFNGHLTLVAEVLFDAGASREMIAAGYLHNAVAHGAVTLDEIEREFGVEVAAMVGGLTDRWHGHAGALSHAQNLALDLERLAAESAQVQTVKLADDLARLRQVHLVESAGARGADRRGGCAGGVAAAGRFAGALPGARGAGALDGFGHDAPARACDLGFVFRQPQALARIFRQDADFWPVLVHLKKRCCGPLAWIIHEQIAARQAGSHHPVALRAPPLLGQEGSFSPPLTRRGGAPGRCPGQAPAPGRCGVLRAQILHE